ncbi:MAG: efflux RND transporter periplasmic adaptor subunit [Candidatus Omnitrophica bacterium]|nr:efflux RND transporter periplasmic adaptor subunit [Candidatus Omnitrophota bacterium]
MKLKIFFILIAAVISTGCSGNKSAKQEIAQIAVSEPLRTAAHDHLELVGNVQAINMVELVARVAGYLDKVFFNDGQIVKKDTLLFLIEQDTYQARLKQAEGQVAMQKALLKYAQAQLIRYKKLFAYKAAAKSDVDNWRYQRDSAKANLKIAQANKVLAKLDLDYTEVRAPFDGRIDRRLQDPGNLVGSGENTPLTQLTQINPLYVYFTISDTDFARLLKSSKTPPQPDSKDWKIRVGLVNEEGFPHEGYIDFTSSTVSTTTGTLLLRGIIPNPSGEILPGTYARIYIPLEEKNSMLLPEEAIANDQLGEYVFILNSDNIIERRDIKTGFSVDNLITIEEGLNGDEMVVIKGLLKVSPGKRASPRIEQIKK